LYVYVGSNSDIGEHEKSKIRDFRKWFRKTNEQEFGFRLIILRDRLVDIQGDTLSIW